MVGRDVHDDGDERALPVRLGDDTVGEQTAGSLVLPDRRVPTVPADTALSAVAAKLHAEAATVRLVVVLVDGRGEAHPPHRGARRRLHQSGVLKGRPDADLQEEHEK